MCIRDSFKDEERKPFLKIGMELFYAEGPDIVREIKARGHKIFLDLKLHDIPNTVKKAMKVLSKLDVDMTNLHAAGTIAMMEAAKEGLTKEDGTCGVLLAVTQLTSTSEERMQQELLDDNSYVFCSFLRMSMIMKANVSGLEAHTCDFYELTADLDIQ